MLKALLRGGRWGGYAALLLVMLGSVETALYGTHRALEAAPVACLLAIVVSLLMELIEGGTGEAPSIIMAPLLAIALYPPIAAFLSVFIMGVTGGLVYAAGALAAAISLYTWALGTPHEDEEDEEGELYEEGEEF